MSGSNTPEPPAPLTPEQITEWLEYSLSGLRSRRDEIIAALEATTKAHPTIEDDDTLGLVAENIRMASALQRVSEERRQEAKKPYLEGGRTVDGWVSDLLKPLNAAVAPIQIAMNNYGSKKLALAREAAEKARKEAQEEADRHLKAAAKAMESSAPNLDDQMAVAQEAAAQAQRATDRANAPASELSRTRGIYGATASMRTVWKWRLVDISKLPMQFHTANEDKIKEAIKTFGRDGSGKPLADIPGLEIYPERVMGVR